MQGRCEGTLSTQHKNEIEEFEIECLVTYCPRAGRQVLLSPKNKFKKVGRTLPAPKLAFRELHTQKRMALSLVAISRSRFSAF